MVNTLIEYESGGKIEVYQMMKRGVKQSNRVIVEDCGVGRFYAKRTIYNRIHFEQQNIYEVYIRTTSGLELLYKKEED